MPAHALVERAPGNAVEDTATLLSEVLGPPEGWGINVRLWDGAVLGPPDAPATVVLRHPWSLRRMLWPSGDVSAGEAFVFGDVDVEGDIAVVFRALAPAIDLESRKPKRLAQLMWHLWRLPAPPPPTRLHQSAPAGALHSRARDRAAIRHHYDVSNDFYRLWLDSHMQYSCAYFEREDDDLEAAQTAKLAHICRKLRLEPGERLLDIGCGWGGLLEYAASHYGIRGLGVTLSEPQAAEANARLARAGVAGNARAEVRDYRDIDGEFDAIVSVGMVEHVGAVNLARYFSKAFALLKPGGVFLNHGIAAAWPGQTRRHRGGFVQRYVFPDSELVPISRMLTESERAGFEVRDVENLREHYASTLRHWVARLEAAHRLAVLAADEIIYRIWVLYMTGCAFSFDRGALELFQSLLYKPTGGPSRLPPTRADWYAHLAGAAAPTS
jgi:cyclopropane-fatty-acyl-phospholipid synthase